MRALTEREKGRQELEAELAPIIERIDEQLSRVEARVASIQTELKRLDDESDA